MSGVWSYLEAEAKILLNLYWSAEALYATQIATNSGMPNVTVFDNLSNLKEEGFVKEEIRGRMKFYELTENGKREAELIINSMYGIVRTRTPKELSASILIGELPTNLKEMNPQNAQTILELWRIKLDIDKILSNWDTCYEPYPRVFSGALY